jgi:hypothetical protein
MKEILLLIVLIAPDGNPIKTGYSEVKFTDFIGCYEFVNEMALKRKDILPNGVMWAPDFKFISRADDGSAIMGQCQAHEFN